MSNELRFSSPEPIGDDHVLEGFDCGNEALNRYLHRYARQNHSSGGARVYVSTRGDRVVGYYCLATAHCLPRDAPSRVARGMTRYPIPTLLLGRLATDISVRGSGLGRSLLKDALLRCAQAADTIGVRAVMVHAKDEAARMFYMKYGFEPSPTDHLHLFLLMKDIRRNLG